MLNFLKYLLGTVGFQSFEIMQSKLEDAGNSENGTKNFMPTQNPTPQVSSEITSTRALGSTSRAACPFSVQTDWTEVVLPKYETNKDKFLVSLKKNFHKIPKLVKFRQRSR